MLVYVRPLADFFERPLIADYEMDIAPRNVEQFPATVPMEFVDGHKMWISREHGVFVTTQDAEFVCSTAPLNLIFVEPKYRNRHYAEEMVYYFMRMNPDYRPRHTPVRTEAGAKVYRAAWRRIVADSIIPADATMTVFGRRRW